MELYLVDTISREYTMKKTMEYSRVIIAKVGLGIGSEDEIFWVRRHSKEDTVCAEALSELAELGGLPSSGFCIETARLIECGDTNNLNRDRDHLMACERCARIGQYVSTMPFPSLAPEVRPLSLIA